jgi:hypothetical protein
MKPSQINAIQNLSTQKEKKKPHKLWNFYISSEIQN